MEMLNAGTRTADVDSGRSGGRAPHQRGHGSRMDTTAQGYLRKNRKARFNSRKCSREHAYCWPCSSAAINTVRTKTGAAARGQTMQALRGKMQKTISIIPATSSKRHRFTGNRRARAIYPARRAERISEA